MKKNESKEKLLKCGIELYMENYNRPTTGSIVAKRAGLPRVYINFYFGNSTKFWDEVALAASTAVPESLSLTEEDDFLNSDEIRQLDFDWQSACSAPPELKIIEYQSTGRNHVHGKAVYCFFGKRCVFTGMADMGIAGSTFNSAEAIVGAIINKEEIAINEIPTHSFYDLQTHKSCRTYLPGRYHLNRLTLGAGVDNLIVGVTSWNEEDCPKIVFDTFQDFHMAKKRHSEKELTKLKLKSFPVSITEAAYFGFLETIDVLTENGLSINHTDSDGTSVLDAAVMGKCGVNFINYLRGKGAKPGVELHQSA